MTYNPTTKAWPRVRTRIECVTVRQPSICCPHNLLKLPEFREETWFLVVDLRSILRDYKTYES